MRISPIRVTTVASAAIALSGLAACSSTDEASPAVAPALSAASAVKHTTLEFVAADEPDNMAVEDLGAKSAPGGPDLGDLLAFTQTLTRDGKRVGQVHVVAVGVDHKRQLSEATGTIMLDDGSIQLAGIVATDPTFMLTVTGGTRAYADQIGTMAFDGSGNVQKMTVHLTSKG